MKYIKYFLLALPLAFFMASCDEHELGYADSDSAEGLAMYQISYPRPVAVTAANGLDSLFLNGKKIAGVGGTGYLAINGTFPSTNRHYTAPVGTNHLVAYKSDNVVYEQDIVLKEGFQRVFIHDLTKAPVIIDDIYPLTPLHADGARATVETFDTDSLIRVRMYNFLYQNGAPYTGKLQYQWSNNSGSSYTAGDWYNIGEPVGFGEATEYGEVIVHKSVYNSSGYGTIRYRCLDQTGTQITALNDYWSGYIGRFNAHMLRGNLGGSPAPGYTQTTTNY